MAGGVFVDRPFSPNLKCVAFGFLANLIYIGTVKSLGGVINSLIVALIFIASYTLLAWYDYAYGCTNVMFSGTGPSLHFATLFKPQKRDIDLLRRAGDTRWDAQPDGTVGVDPTFSAIAGASSRAQLAADQELEYKKKVYFFHLSIVAPLLLYIGLRGANADPRIWGFVAGLGAIAGIYHGSRYASLALFK